MKNINLISLTLVVITVAIGLLNYNNGAEFTMNISSLSFVKMISHSVSTGALIFGFYFLGIMTGLIFMLQFVMKSGCSIKAYERKLEKTSISNDSSTAKIQVLENKIQVLEKALADALKNK